MKREIVKFSEFLFSSISWQVMYEQMWWSAEDLSKFVWSN